MQGLEDHECSNTWMPVGGNMLLHYKHPNSQMYQVILTTSEWSSQFPVMTPYWNDLDCTTGSKGRIWFLTNLASIHTPEHAHTHTHTFG